MANFIHFTGTNGFLSVAPVNLIASTELNALGSGNTVLSATVLNQTALGSGTRGLICLTVITAGWNVAAGGNICGWWVHSRDGGTTYEAVITNTALARAPDFIIPLPTVSPIAVGDYYANGIPELPYDTCKAYLQNNCGTVTSSNTHLLRCYPVADTYA